MEERHHEEGSRRRLPAARKAGEREPSRRGHQARWTAARPAATSRHLRRSSSPAAAAAGAEKTGAREEEVEQGRGRRRWSRWCGAGPSTSCRRARRWRRTSWSGRRRTGRRRKGLSGQTGRPRSPPRRGAPCTGVYWQLRLRLRLRPLLCVYLCTLLSFKLPKLSVCAQYRI